ncbi:MAG TPA: NAD+ synthase [Solirubrobacteraceae bacterium]|nr:NAD+ synthase [Solirubrobacteraceae bacterium]
MVVGLAQINPVIGDLPGNVELMRARVEDARAAGAQLVLFPELAVCGYPPEDLLGRSDFLAACSAAAEEVAAAARDVVVAFGVPLNGPRDLHNCLVVAAEGEVKVVYEKRHLPHYGTFDEGRYFGRGRGPVVVRLGDRLVGLCVCADLWVGDGPATAAARAGAELIINASASPFHSGKAHEREAMLAQRARELVCPIAYANCWGGHDELVFDGGSLVVDHRGRVLARAEHFAEELLVVPLDLRSVRSSRLRDPRLRTEDTGADPSSDGAEAPHVALPLVASEVGASPVAEVLDPDAELWSALRLGIADQAAKNGLDHSVVGLGGGIDSSVVALLACEALGPERVTAVIMPAADSDPRAEEAARELVAALGCDLREVAVDGLRAAYEDALGPRALSSGPGSASTEERVLARVRSNVLMALTNVPGRLLLSTGNKSELACGYSTLYGETFGGFAPLKDVPRTTVVRLARWRQGDAPGPIPASILTDPHGGVRPSLWRQDGLPPFEAVDPILQAYVEEEEDPEELMARGHDPAVVRRVVDLVERAEPKRRQAPPGIRISARAFGQDRRMPLAHRFRPRGEAEHDIVTGAAPAHPR